MNNFEYENFGESVFDPNVVSTTSPEEQRVMDLFNEFMAFVPEDVDLTTLLAERFQGMEIEGEQLIL